MDLVILQALILSSMMLFETSNESQIDSPGGNETGGRSPRTLDLID